MSQKTKTNGKGTKLSNREPTELSELAEKISVKLNGIRDGLRTTVQDAIEAGELLIEAKAAQDHGCFSKWCKQHFKVSSRQIEKYMRLAKYVREAKANPSSDLEVILEGGIAAALRSFQIREEDLPPVLTRKAAKQFLGIPLDGREEDEEEDDDEGEDRDEPSDDSEDKSSGDAAEAIDDTKARARDDSRGLKKWVQGSYSRADNALGQAKRDGDWARYRDLITPAALEKTRLTAAAWKELYDYLKPLCEPLQQAAE